MATKSSIEELTALQNIYNATLVRQLEAGRSVGPLPKLSRWYWFKWRWRNRAGNVKDAWAVLRGKAYADYGYGEYW